MTIHERIVSLMLPGSLCDPVRAELLRSAQAMEATAEDAEATVKRAGETPSELELTRWQDWRDTAAALRRVRDAIPSVIAEESES